MVDQSLKEQNSRFAQVRFYQGILKTVRIFVLLFVPCLNFPLFYSPNLSK